MVPVRVRSVTLAPARSLEVLTPRARGTGLEFRRRSPLAGSTPAASAEADRLTRRPSGRIGEAPACKAGPCGFESRGGLSVVPRRRLSAKEREEARRELKMGDRGFRGTHCRYPLSSTLNPQIFPSRSFADRS